MSHRVHILPGNVIEIRRGKQSSSEGKRMSISVGLGIRDSELRKSSRSKKDAGVIAVLAGKRAGKGGHGSATIKVDTAAD